NSVSFQIHSHLSLSPRICRAKFEFCERQTLYSRQTITLHPELSQGIGYDSKTKLHLFCSKVDLKTLPGVMLNLWSSPHRSHSEELKLGRGGGVWSETSTATPT
ncbi:hypothetical protein WMY93_031396, partial [Mugilogobius chulae]